MILRHKFLETHMMQQDDDFIREPKERLVEDDFCVYCDLIITKDMATIFDDDDPLCPGYQLAYNEINNLYKCLTEEEYLIKKLLE